MGRFKDVKEEIEWICGYVFLGIAFPSAVPFRIANSRAVHHVRSASRVKKARDKSSLQLRSFETKVFLAMRQASVANRKES
jgi:hypothetical protein